MIDTENLRTFLEVYQAGGFTRAGDTLGRSQPAISRRISQLEETLGVPLFERGAGGGRLTTAGEALLGPAEKVLAALADCAACMRDLAAGTSGEVRLAVVGTLANHALTGCLKAFRRTHAGVPLRLQTALSREVSQLVRSGDATIGLRYHEDTSPDLVCTQIATEKLVVIAARDHPAASRRSIRLKDLRDEPWLAFSNAGEHDDASDNIFAQFLTRGISGLACTSVDSLTAQKRLVESGLGLCLIPESAIGEEVSAGHLAILPVSDLTAENPVMMVTRSSGYVSPAAGKLIDDLAKLFVCDRTR